MNAHQGSSAVSRREALRERDREQEQAVIARLTSLGAALDGEPDPAFRAAARSRLVAMAAVRAPGTPVAAGRPTVREGWRRRLTAGLATVAVAAAALTTLVALGAGSGPGDPLYGVKRGTEQTELALAGHWRRGPILLDLAGTRLAELRALAARPSPDQALMLQTLHTMDAETADAAGWFAARALDSHSAAPLDQLAQWRSGQSTALAVLRPELPTTVSTAVDHSLGVLMAAQRRVDAVRMTLTPAAVPPVTRKPTGSAPTGSLPGAPSSVVGTPGAGAPSSGTARSGSIPAAPTTGPLPTLPSPGASSGPGGLPTLPVPVPGASSLPTTGLSLPTLPVPSGAAICVGPISVGHC